MLLTKWIKVQVCGGLLDLAQKPPLHIFSLFVRIPDVESHNYPVRLLNASQKLSGCCWPDIEKVQMHPSF